jgi:hypothetical protein
MRKFSSVVSIHFPLTYTSLTKNSRLYTLFSALWFVFRADWLLQSHS